MKVINTAKSDLRICNECGRPSGHMIEYRATPFHFVCEECVIESLALLRHATSATPELEPFIANE